MHKNVHFLPRQVINPQIVTLGEETGDEWEDSAADDLFGGVNGEIPTAETRELVSTAADEPVRLDKIPVEIHVVWFEFVVFRLPRPILCFQATARLETQMVQKVEEIEGSLLCELVQDEEIG